ncbi:sex comb on midleg-like protein 4 [Gouania willdenowi]|uniref:Sex comb on midleg-like protein 4 n=1 Tax=Gouania willdenowi TaxID=441366 RepID=A0A8C5GG01_GOUWI|nr:sex comb on midleg-like protein 4 [Gouania willdenowi]XP_028295665.1 sex comb on midleg-like protein 4 [Gouania willdenowi]XP_028295666.1 sex comb on midleg-like protein 4 [Gouania willdenowi]
MSIFPLSSEMQSSTLGPSFMTGQTAKVSGRKRGRPPIRRLEYQHHYVEALLPPKIPKKRGRKPGFKLKPRMGMSPHADSPPSSTPEPETGSIPQDAAIVPQSATPVLTDTTMPDDFSKRYSVDPGDSSFNMMASPYLNKHSYGYRGSSCTASVGVCRKATRPGSLQEANRNGYSPMPDSAENKCSASKDPSRWGVEDVIVFITDADPQALGPLADAFRKHEIDGGALLLLKSETMMKYLGMKLGPALKLCYHIDRLRQKQL